MQCVCMVKNAKKSGMNEFEYVYGNLMVRNGNKRMNETTRK